MKVKPWICTTISLCTQMRIICDSPLSNLKLGMQIFSVTVSHFKPNLGRAGSYHYQHHRIYVLTVHVLRLIVYTIVAGQGSMNHTLCFQLTLQSAVQFNSTYMYYHETIIKLTDEFIETADSII